MMKKIVASFAAFFLTVSMPVLFAQMPLGVPMTLGVSADLMRIGVVAAAGGKVELTTPGQVGRIAQSGQAIFMGDEVKTDAEGHLQILLLDETVFTIGPNSAIIIDKFVYDPKSHSGEIKASITKGVFRYVSGKIAAKDPDSVKVKLPTATLGFRGTIVGGSVGADGQGLVGLMGPGDNNDTGAQIGSFTATGTGGDSQEVNRTGFGVETGADGGVSGVFQLSGDQVSGLTQGLGGGQGSGDQGGDEGGGENGGEGGAEVGLGGNTDMGALSGEEGALTGVLASTVAVGEGLSDGMGDLTAVASQQIAAANALATNANGITTLAELASITSGTNDYSVSGAFTQTWQAGASADRVGTLIASWTADFPLQHICGISVTINTTGDSGNLNISNAALTDVNFDDGINNQAVFSTSDAGGDITATITLRNNDAGIAHIGEIAVTFDNRSSVEPDDLGSGSGSVTL